MWALSFLLFFVFALLAIKLLTAALPSKARVAVWLLAAGSVMSFPFWYHLYPSYREFQTLCDRSDRYAVLKTVDVANLYYTAAPFYAYAFSQRRGFVGFDIEQGTSGYLRYSRSKEWDSHACQAACANPDVGIWIHQCEPRCLIKTPVDAPEFKHTATFSHAWLIEDRLMRDRQVAVDMAGNELAVALNYRYYPYGNGWAKLLGLSSGSVPTQSCPTKADIWNLDFLRPATNQP